VTVPALIGPVIGPPVGGFITTYATWHWIFIINIPIGLIGIALALHYIGDFRAEKYQRFDLVGMMLAGIGIAGVAFGFSVLGLDFLPWSVVAALIVGGALFLLAYLWHARRTPSPVMDLSLFRLHTFRASITGGFVFRFGVGAIPFLLPLMLQLGFGMTPFQSGLITFTSAAGSMAMKVAAATMLRWFGFRTILIVDAVVSAAFLAAIATFTPTTPIAVMVSVLLVGGFFRSLQFTCVNTIAYADVEPQRIGAATALMTVSRQLALSAGVAFGALAVQLVVQMRGDEVIRAADFHPAFLAAAVISALSLLIFLRLPLDAGAEMSGRRPPRRASS
jgi:MFS family permease